MAQGYALGGNDHQQFSNSPPMSDYNTIKGTSLDEHVSETLQITGQIALTANRLDNLMAKLLGGPMAGSATEKPRPVPCGHLAMLSAQKIEQHEALKRIADVLSQLESII